ncbi:Cytochrome c556 [Poseidonocella pacifica]|uniref:Cytochrome c556 n=1 Tax=Poseidonocella pacifica TaxID=871651 RepID=A0A1I0XK49_9RHOB|nr:cytochrome c [Poseidonocella pacifica]SFB01499.1 Cytochrome c556 [Poseidonocella pacifica]
MKTFFSAALAASLVLGGAATAQDYAGHLKARQGQFRILAINLGILGSIAKGETAYDEATAGAAAQSIKAVTMINQAPLWPEGSDNMSIDGTRGQPSIWDDFADFESKWSALGTAADAMVVAAAEGQGAIGPALGQLGGACKACHEKHRAPEN